MLAVTAQVALGSIGILVIHVPLGVAIMAAQVVITVSAFRHPARTG